jgi:spoIIIJ-associated protein
VTDVTSTPDAEPATDTPAPDTPAPAADATAPEDALEDGPGGAASEAGAAPARGARVERLEEEGEVAADYLEELLDIVDLDGDIDIDVEDGRASLSIVGEGDDDAGTPVGSSSPLRTLTGRRGDVLEALQELTRLAVQARTGERSRLMLDIAGYRAQRRAELEALAARAVQDAREQGEPVRLAPMNPFERKVVHDAVAHAGLVSDSEGVEPQRRVVVHPA